MIPVELLTEKMLEARFNSLPEKIRTALTSDSHEQIVMQICQNSRIMDEEKKEIVQQIVALTLLGFVHTYDVSKEMNEALELNNPKLTDSIAEEMNAKIFSPIKNDLDAIYKPLLPNENVIVTKAVVKDIGGAPLMKTSNPLPAAMPLSPKPLEPIIKAPTTTQQMSSGMPTVAGRSAGGMPIAPAPQKPLSESGWSRTTPTAPTVRFTTTQTPPPVPPASIRPPMPSAPAPTLKPTPAPVAPISPMSAPKNPPVPQAPQPAVGPAPVMLHEDTKFTAAQKSADFHLSMSSANVTPSMGGAKSGLPVKPAVLEFGDPHISFTPGGVPQSPAAAPAVPSMPKPPAPPTPPVTSPNPTTPGVVHYTEFQPQMGSMPPIPKPLQAPQSRPPSEPQPQPQQNRVVTKNY